MTGLLAQVLKVLDLRMAFGIYLDPTGPLNSRPEPLPVSCFFWPLYTYKLHEALPVTVWPSFK